LFSHIVEARDWGLQFKVVILGPLTYLHLGKVPTGVDKLSLLPALLEAFMTFTLQTTRRGLDEAADP